MASSEGPTATATVRRLDLAAGLWLLLLCASWGAQQVAVKTALPSIPPLSQMALRSAGACAIVAGIVLLSGRRHIFARDGSLWWGLLVGALFSAEFVLIYLGLQWTDASRSAVFIYTAPFFVAVSAPWLLPDERLNPLQWIGILASFAGILIALGTPSLEIFSSRARW